MSLYGFFKTLRGRHRKAKNDFGKLIFALSACSLSVNKLTQLQRNPASPVRQSQPSFTRAQAKSSFDKAQQLGKAGNREAAALEFKKAGDMYRDLKLADDAFEAYTSGGHFSEAASAFYGNGENFGVRFAERAELLQEAKLADQKAYRLTPELIQIYARKFEALKEAAKIANEKGTFVRDNWVRLVTSEASVLKK